MLTVKANGIEISYPGSGKDQLKQLLTILYKTRKLKPTWTVLAETNCSVYKVIWSQNQLILEETNE